MNQLVDVEELFLKDIRIERLGSKRLEEVVDLIHRSIRKTWSGEYAVELIEAFCGKYNKETMRKRMDEADYWVAKDGSGRLLGVIGLKGNQLRTFFVDPKCQRRGVGRKLYERLESGAKERGLSKLVLEGSLWGQKAYRTFGFKKVGEKVKERAGVKYKDAIMKKQLN